MQESPNNAVHYVSGLSHLMPHSEQDKRRLSEIPQSLEIYTKLLNLTTWLGMENLMELNASKFVLPMLFCWINHNARLNDSPQLRLDTLAYQLEA